MECYHLDVVILRFSLDEHDAFHVTVVAVL